MESRRQHTTRAAWGTTRASGLCSALAMLLAALAVCQACVTGNSAASGAASMTTVSATTMLADSTTHHGPEVAHPADCPSDDECCDAATDGVRAVLATPTQPLPAVLPRMPHLPRRPDTAPGSVPPAPTARAPDLHVLQVQRT